MKFATNYKSTFKYGTLQLRLVLTIKNNLNRKIGGFLKRQCQGSVFGTAFIVFIPTLRFLPNVSYLKIPKKSQDHLYQ